MQSDHPQRTQPKKRRSAARTPAQRERNRERVAKILADRSALLKAIKLESGCIDCGYNAHPAALEFDHRPGEVKVSNVASMRTCNLKRMLDEIAKCDVRCANCHQIKTAERGGWE